MCGPDLGGVWCASFSLSTPVPADGPAAYPIPVQTIKPLLTVSFTSGDISLMSNYDDLSPTVIQSGLKGTDEPVRLAFPAACPLQPPPPGLKDPGHRALSFRSSASVKSPT